MKPVGEIFKLKTKLEELRGELTPSFNEVIEGWLGIPVRTKFKDPDYVYSITYFTKPLELFLERIVDQLKTYSIVGGPLERGFGFGKTHTLILLWHLFNSDLAYRLRGSSISEKLVKETLVLGMDFSSKKPFAKIIQELEAYVDPKHSVSKIKDPRLVQAVSEALREYPRSKLLELTSSDLADLVYKILKAFEDKGGTPRLLLLIDELGWGLVNRIRRYVDNRKDEHYKEVDMIINFLSYLYEKLFGKGIPAIVIWVLAEQDKMEINAIGLRHQDDHILFGKIKGLMDHLSIIAQRYQRGTGGLSIAELSFSPEHTIEIARYRVLETVNNSVYAKAKDEFIQGLEKLAWQLNLVEAFNEAKDYLDKYYPFSLGLINFLVKLTNREDVPRTEFVRTIIYMAAEAAENALMNDPLGSYVIGIKHLDIPKVACINLMGEFETDWVNVVSDIEHVIEGLEIDRRIPAEILAKYILAKGITANIPLLLEAQDERTLKRYGSTLDEIQLEILSSFKESNSLKHIEKITEALEELKAESARIDSREIEDRKYYLPALLKTIYDKLSLFTIEERRKLDNRNQVPMYMVQSAIPSLFSNLRLPNDAMVMLKEFRKVRESEVLLSDPDFSEAQNSGNLAIVIIPPWDLELFNDMYLDGKSYESVLDSLTRRLQAVISNGRMKRPLHVVVVVPALTEARMTGLLNDLAVYEGTKRFIEYLENREKIIEERIREYEDTFIKRKTILDHFTDEIKRRRERELKSILERQINDARMAAQKQLVAFSRKLAIEVLELYSKVIYYSLDQQAFTYRDLASLSLEASRKADEVSEKLKGYEEVVANLDKYAAIMNRFLDIVIDYLGYIKDPVRIAEVLKESYEEEFSHGVIREADKIDDILESIMLGTYGVKPISLKVADNALNYLNQHVIELDDKIVKIILDRKEGIIKFEVEEKEKPVEVHVETPAYISSRPQLVSSHPALLENYIERILVSLSLKDNVRDFIFRLFTLVSQVKVSSIEISSKGAKISANISIGEIESGDQSLVESITNFIFKLASRYGGEITVQIRLAERITEQKVKEILGDYYKPRQSGLDRLLPL